MLQIKAENVYANHTRPGNDFVPCLDVESKLERPRRPTLLIDVSFAYNIAGLLPC